MQRRTYRVELVIANLLVLVLAAACVSLDFGASTAPAGSGSSSDGAVAAATDAPTVGPRKTKKPKRTPPPSAAAVTAEPTLAPTDQPTEAPTDTPLPPDVTPDPNATPFCCQTFRLPPIGPIGSLLVLEPRDPTLDYTASPIYGEANLSAGFAPDPYSVGMTVGGPVDVSYLGSSCSGFATVAPDLRVNFSAGGSLLRLYFVGSNGDTTIVINDPFGNFYCVDDSFGTVHPTIDFNNPAGGAYDIWVGSYASGTTVSGTFSTTQSSANHP